MVADEPVVTVVVTVVVAGAAPEPLEHAASRPRAAAAAGPLRMIRFTLSA
jgi:hypothetical protein